MLLDRLLRVVGTRAADALTQWRRAVTTATAVVARSALRIHNHRPFAKTIHLALG